MVDGQVSPEFEVRNGSTHKDTCVRCAEHAVDVFGRHGEKLVGESTRRSCNEKAMELQFACQVAVGTSKE